MAEAKLYYEDRLPITCKATGSITAGQLVKISANRAAGENIKVAAVAALTDVVFGVAGTGTSNGGLLPVHRHGVVGCIAGGSISAGDRVMCKADGTVIAYTVGTVATTVTGDAQSNVAGTVVEHFIVGIACADASLNDIVPIALSI